MKELLKSAARSAGYELFSLNRPGMDPFRDIAALMKAPEPMILDVGANVGQSAAKLRSMFPAAMIHCFEPSPRTFEQLEQNTSNDLRIAAHNCGMAAAPAQRPFFDNQESVLSSFLRPGADAWSTTVTETKVTLDTIDAFCAQQHIESIDLLKSDTQGYDLEVLKGAKGMLESGKIRLVYLELNFARIYEGQALPGSVIDFLLKRGFRLFSLYQIFRQNNFAAWTDALFVSRNLE